MGLQSRVRRVLRSIRGARGADDIHRAGLLVLRPVASECGLIAAALLVSDRLTSSLPNREFVMRQGNLSRWPGTAPPRQGQPHHAVYQRSLGARDPHAQHPGRTALAAGVLLRMDILVRFTTGALTSKDLSTTPPGLFRPSKAQHMLASDRLRTSAFSMER